MESKWKSWYNWGVPLFDLPPPPAYRLSRAPLVQALVQVRYPLVAALESLAGIAPLQAVLQDSFPYMDQEKVQEVAFLVGPAGPAGSAAESVNWKFTNDSGTQITIGAGSASLAAGEAYSGVANFANEFRLLLSALETARIKRCDRLGVRYLSVASDPAGQSTAWRDWFKPELIGWIGSDIIPADGLSMAISQVQLSHPPSDDLASAAADVQTVVRHGAVPEGTSVPGLPPVTVSAPSYLLDIDVFVAAPQPFRPDAIVQQFSDFHSQIDRFFFWTLTDAGKDQFELRLLEN